MSAAKRPKRIQPRKCLHCQRWFTPAPNNAHKQRFCSKRKCRNASHRVSQRKYQLLNPDDAATKAKNVEKTNKWRMRNHGYSARLRIPEGSNAAVTIGETMW